MQGLLFQLQGCDDPVMAIAAWVGRPELTSAIIGGGRLALAAAVAGCLQGKEARSTPGRAGDGASDRGEAPICDSLPVEAVADGRDGVAPALILANEDGPGFELARWRAVVSREALQEPQAVAIKAAKSSLLQPRGNHPTQQVLAQAGGGHPSEHQPPLPPQRVDLQRTDAIDLGRDRGRFSPAPPHDQALGWVARGSGSLAAGLPPAIR